MTADHNKIKTASFRQKTIILSVPCYEKTQTSLVEKQNLQFAKVTLI